MWKKLAFCAIHLVETPQCIYLAARFASLPLLYSGRLDESGLLLSFPLKASTSFNKRTIDVRLNQGGFGDRPKHIELS